MKKLTQPFVNGTNRITFSPFHKTDSYSTCPLFSLLEFLQSSEDVKWNCGLVPPLRQPTFIHRFFSTDVISLR